MFSFLPFLWKNEMFLCQWRAPKRRVIGTWPLSPEKHWNKCSFKLPYLHFVFGRFPTLQEEPPFPKDEEVRPAGFGWWPPNLILDPLSYNFSIRSPSSGPWLPRPTMVTYGSLQVEHMWSYLPTPSTAKDVEYLPHHLPLYSSDPCLPGECHGLSGTSRRTSYYVYSSV